MKPRILLVSTADPRCRQLEDLLADGRTTARRLGPGPGERKADGDAPPWVGPAPDLLVLGALGGTQEAVELARSSLTREPDLSVLVVDEPDQWPETLRHRMGLMVVAPGDRAGFAAARERLLERRELLRQAGRREVDRAGADVLAEAALVGELPAVREMRIRLDRELQTPRCVVVAGETGTLRGRVLRRRLREVPWSDPVVVVEDVDELSPTEQGRILDRVREGHRVAATATARFRDRVAEGAFRTDLYYALGGSPVVTVPLRERRDDLGRLMSACGLDTLTPECLARLCSHDWPGNLRQLELVCELACLLARGQPVGDEHLMLPEPEGREAPDAFVLNIPSDGVALDQVEREAIRQTLEAADSNIAEAARRLGIERGKLRYRLRRYELGR